MKQEHYGAISMIALFTAALFVENLPIVSALCLAVIVFCLIKGQLWEIKEEKEKSPPRTRTGAQKNIYNSTIPQEMRVVKR